MKTVGIISIVWSSLNLFMNFISFVWVFFEKFLLHSILYNSIDSPQNVNLVDFINNMATIVMINFPAQLIIEGLLLFGGIKILRNDSKGIQLCRAYAWSNMVWFVTYMTMLYFVLSDFLMGYLGSHGTHLFPVLMIAASLIGFIFKCGYSVFLLVFMRNRATL